MKDGAIKDGVALEVAAAGSRAAVAEAVRERIRMGEWDPGAKLPSRSVLAAEYAVSESTITLAMRELAADGVVKFVPGKGIFVPRHAAGRRPFTLGLIGWFSSCEAGALDWRPETHWNSMIRELASVCREKRHAFMVIPDADHEPVDVERIIACGVDCVVTYGIPLRPETILDFRRRGMPVVLGNQSLEEMGVSYVDYDGIGYLREAARLFLRRGISRIAWLIPNMLIPSLQERCRQAVIMELASAGVQYDYGAYWRTTDGGRLSDCANRMRAWGREEIARLLALSDPPSAAFSTNPIVAEGMAEGAAAAGKRIGVDFSVATTGLSAHEAQLSLFVLPHEEYVRRLVETATHLAADPHGVHQILLPLTYVEKGSVARRHG